MISINSFRTARKTILPWTVFKPFLARITSLSQRWALVVAIAVLCTRGALSHAVKWLTRYRDEQDVPLFLTSFQHAASASLPRTVHTLSCGVLGAHGLPFPSNFTAQLNPLWKLTVHDVESGQSYVQKFCPAHLNAYRSLKPVSFKSDLLRFCILYTEGGVWMDDDILLLKKLDELTDRIHTEVLFVYDRPVYKLAGGPGQVWTAFIVATPQSRIFERAMQRISENVARRKHFRHSLYYTGPALLYSVIKADDSVEFRWRMQNQKALSSSSSQRVADALSNEEVLLHFKLTRANAHYSKMSRSKDVYT